MKTRFSSSAWHLWAVALVALWGSAGCNKPANHSEKVPNADHAHDHDHAHHGPHHGHLMEIGGEEYHAEWTHDESGKVTFYILDAEAKKEVPVDAQELTIDVKIGGNSPVTYKLPAVSPKDGKSATFEIVDKQLLGVLETLKSPGIVATLHVNVNGKQFDQRIEEHEHSH
jgi:hypothetical protein